jgi:hypothetical protein
MNESAPVQLPRGSRAAGRFPPGPARYTVIGGGCFGRFYARQLLRYADRGGPVAAIEVVDRDPHCAVAREITDPRLTLVVADWADHVSLLLPAAMARIAAGGEVRDRLVPSPFASHVLLEAMRRAAAPAARVVGPGESQPLFTGIPTPFHRLLDSGSAALSFATWICPVNCIEPATCPAISGPLDWEMAGTVKAALPAGESAVRSLHVLACLHEAFGVGTIPIADLARESLALRAAAECFARTPAGTPGYAVIATVSTCHGLAGALRLGSRL